MTLGQQQALEAFPRALRGLDHIPYYDILIGLVGKIQNSWAVSDKVVHAANPADVLLVVRTVQVAIRLMT